MFAVSTTGSRVDSLGRNGTRHGLFFYGTGQNMINLVKARLHLFRLINRYEKRSLVLEEFSQSRKA